MQPKECADLAHILQGCADQLYDATCMIDKGDMWEQARDAASRILAVTEPYAVAAGSLSRTIQLHLNPGLESILQRIAAAAGQLKP
jgi:hypothetical protein